MSALGRALRPRAAPRAEAIGSSRELYEHLLRGYESDSGATVTAETAMKLAAYFACMRVLGETMASAPCLFFERTAGGKERAAGHWAYRLLHDEPNAWQTPAEFIEMLTINSFNGGTGYAIMTKVRDEVRELLPVPPARVVDHQDPVTRRIWHDVTLPDGTVIQVPGDRMFRLPFMTRDGFRGVSLLAYQRETLGLGLQMTKYGAKLFKQGAMVGGVIEMPNDEVMSDDAYRRLQRSFDEVYAGVDNAHKTVILEEGAKYNKTGMSSQDAQFLEQQKWNWNMVCGFCRVPPHLTGYLEKATYSNIEVQDLGFLKYTMLPIFRRTEQRISKQIIPAADRGRFFAEFMVDALLRADSAARAAYYRTAIMTGWMNRQEVRIADNLNKGPAELEAFLTPLNMAVAGEPLDDFTKKEPGHEAAA